VGVGQLAKAMLGAVVGVEEDLGELVGGEHAVLEHEAEDGAVAVGEPAGKGGELVGHAAPPGGSSWTRAEVRARVGGGGVHAGHLRQESGAVHGW
jgi:hypothetical protein